MTDHISGMQPEELDALASRLYVYNGRPFMDSRNNTFAMPGDVFWREDLANGGMRFTSSRGARWSDFMESAQKDLADGIMQPAAAALSESGRAPMDQKAAMACVRGLAERQSRFEDATEYLSTPDGSKAKALFKSDTGYFSLERDGEHTTLINGMTMLWYNDLQPSDYQAFNPSGGTIVPESGWDRYCRGEAAKQSASPFSKIAAIVTGQVVREPEPPVRPVTALDKLDGFCLDPDGTALPPIRTYETPGRTPVQARASAMDRLQAYLAKSEQDAGPEGPSFDA